MSRDSGEEPASAQGNEYPGRGSGMAFQLDSDGALSRDHRHVVIGRDVGQAAPHRFGPGMDFGLGGIVAVLLDGGAVAGNGGELPGLGPAGNHDPGRQSHPGGGIGHRGAVISGGGGDHPAPPLLRLERQQLAESAPGLEGAGMLPVLQLEPGAEGGIDEGGFEDPGPDAGLGPGDLGNQRVAVHGMPARKKPRVSGRMRCGAGGVPGSRSSGRLLHPTA